MMKSETEAGKNIRICVNRISTLKKENAEPTPTQSMIEEANTTHLPQMMNVTVVPWCEKTIGEAIVRMNGEAN